MSEPILSHLTHLDVQRQGAVAHVWLNRPTVRNAFDATTIAELTEAFRALSLDPGLRAVVLAGRGKAFCAGGDLHWMQAMAGYSWAENHADGQRLADMLWALAECPVPVIGRVQGDCYGGGVGLAAVCDVVVAADTAAFCLSEVKLGLMPATISPYVIRAIGERAARRYFTTAERITAERAQLIGLVHEVCSADRLDGTVDGIVRAIVDNGPQAVRASKALVRDMAGVQLSAGLSTQTAGLIADIRASDEGQEGMRAFLSKSIPAWRQDGDAAPGRG